MITDIVLLPFKGKMYRVQLCGAARGPDVAVEVGGGHRCTTHWRRLSLKSHLSYALAEGARAVLREPGKYPEAMIEKRDGQRLPVAAQTVHRQGGV